MNFLINSAVLTNSGKGRITFGKDYPIMCSVVIALAVVAVMAVVTYIECLK